MKSYDVIVIGSGSGLTVVGQALEEGLKVALVDKGPLGGTCLNLGCIPSKMLIAVADKILDIQNARKLGIEVDINWVDFKAIMERMRKSIQEDREKIRRSIGHIRNLDFYEEPAYFTADKTLKVAEDLIRADKIFIAAGTRPLIPPVKGLEKIHFLTSETVLELEQKPGSLLILGGGYIGVEYAHFFSALGTSVTIVEMTDRLVRNEEPEISGLLKTKLGQRADIRLNSRVVEFSSKDGLISAVIEDGATGEQFELESEAVMIAAGRKPNTDLLKVENTGVELDRNGFIRVDDYLETTRKNVYAFGDIIGRYMFTHVANREAVQVWHNAMHDEPSPMDYAAVPHAVFTHPQIASVGLTEAEASRSHKILVGKARYSEVAMGLAMMEQDGFTKAIIDRESEKILGFHIIGPEASTLIQEVVDVMSAGGSTEIIHQAMHIHPALPEIVQRTLASLEEPSRIEIKSERLKSITPVS